MDRTTIKGARKNFFLSPLTDKDLDEETGLYVDTIEARTGSPIKSPIEDIFEDCTTEGYNFIHLLLGHRGCGKSTELNKLEIKLEVEGFPVRKIDCRADAKSDIGVEDILILISNALLDICKEKNIDIHPNDVEKLKYFFDPTEEVIIDKEGASMSVHTGIGVNFSKIIKLLSEVKGQIIDSSDKIKTIRKNITNSFYDWNICIDNIIEKIKEKNGRKYPIILFENFDKLSAEEAIKIFEKRYLDNIRTYMIFTFPISSSYSEKFGTIEQYTSPHFFPMIDVKTQEGKKNDTGHNTIKKIIEKRAGLHLFEEDAIDTLIEKTGGSLRDVFRCIELALRYTDRNKKERVSMEEVNMALNDEKSILSRRIEKEEYPDLKRIHETKTKTVIENRSKILRFLEAHVVLEYNGNRWHDLHPLICDFLKDKW